MDIHIIQLLIATVAMVIPCLIFCPVKIKVIHVIIALIFPTILSYIFYSIFSLSEYLVSIIPMLTAGVIIIINTKSAFKTIYCAVMGFSLSYMANFICGLIYVTFDNEISNMPKYTEYIIMSSTAMLGIILAILLKYIFNKIQDLNNIELSKRKSFAISLLLICDFFTFLINTMISKQYDFNNIKFATNGIVLTTQFIFAAMLIFYFLRIENKEMEYKTTQLELSHERELNEIYTQAIELRDEKLREILSDDEVNTSNE